MIIYYSFIKVHDILWRAVVVINFVYIYTLVRCFKTAEKSSFISLIRLLITS